MKEVLKVLGKAKPEIVVLTVIEGMVVFAVFDTWDRIMRMEKKVRQIAECLGNHYGNYYFYN